MKTPKWTKADAKRAEKILIESYNELLNRPAPKTQAGYRISIMLAVLIGREIEAMQLKNEVNHPPAARPCSSAPRAD